MPQGSILGQTLFLLYVNDCEDHVGDRAQLDAYADDTTLYKCLSSANFEDQCQELQVAVNAVNAWGQSWHITFEPTKSQALTIDQHRPATVLPPIKFNNIQVQEERYINILRVRFDSQLSFRGHIREVATRANQHLGLLKRAAHVLDKHSRSRVYNAFVRPVMAQTPLVWMGACRSTLSQLDAVQHRAMNMLGPNCCLPRLELRRHVATLSFLFKLHCQLQHPSCRKCYPPPPPRQPQHPALHTTRLQSAKSASPQHDLQLANQLPIAAHSSRCRSLPFAVLPTWNKLPASIPSSVLDLKQMYRFKSAVNCHLTQDAVFAYDFN